MVLNDRNSPCYCGSGQRVRACGERDTEQHKQHMAALPDWEKDRSDAIAQMRQWLKQADDGTLSADMAGHNITHILLKYEAKAPEELSERSWEWIFDCASSLERIPSDYAKDSADFKSLKEAMEKIDAP